MTLTKADLSAIRRVVKDETQPRFEVLKKGQSSLEKGLSGLESRMSNLEKGQNKIQKDLKTVINYFDNENLSLRKRVEKVESKVGIQPSEF